MCRVGGSTRIAVNARVLAATNKDLDAEVAKGTFREDLYYRLKVFELRLPPLRERREDLPLLVDQLISQLNVEVSCRITGIEAGALALLRAHDWPGNVRELQNTLLRAMVLVDGPMIRVGDLALPARRPFRPDSQSADGPQDGLTLGDAVKRATTRVERAFIEAAVSRHAGNRAAAAAALGINRKTLYDKMIAHGMLEADQEGADSPPT